MRVRRRSTIPEDIVCFANLSGDDRSDFANLFSFGFYRQLTQGEIIKVAGIRGKYRVGAVWSREEHLLRK